MDPDRALSQILNIWATAFEGAEWKQLEIRELIETYGMGILGSSHSYSVIHAIVEFGAVDWQSFSGKSEELDTDYIDTLAMQLLLGKELNADSQTKPTGSTALHLAVKLSKVAIAQLLIENGADISAWSGDYNMTVMGLAIISGIKDEEMVSLLIESGADINGIARGGDKPATPLQIALEHKRKAIVQLLVARGADASDNRGGTLLIRATELDQCDEVEILLDSGVSI
jgi:ankyrin repeat protein